MEEFYNCRNIYQSSLCSQITGIEADEAVDIPGALTEYTVYFGKFFFYVPAMFDNFW